jgi:DNA-binding response OmpR family regulator
MKKILVIEDEPALRTMLVKVLNKQGFAANGAPDGYEGLKLVQQNLPNSAPDLIICDIMMPIIDGYDVLTNLRQTRSTASIPVIFLTARVTAEDRRRGLALGADDYIIKPFGLAALLRSINTQLAKKEALLNCITATTKPRKL